MFTALGVHVIQVTVTMTEPDSAAVVVTSTAEVSVRSSTDRTFALDGLLELERARTGRQEARSLGSGIDSPQRRYRRRGRGSIKSYPS